MSVAFDAISSATAGSGNLSWTHTPTGTPSGVVVIVVARADGAAVSGVTYGGTSMTEVTSSPLNSAHSTLILIHVFHLGASIPTGAQTVAVTNSLGATMDAWAVTMTAAADTAVQNTATLDVASSADPSGTLALSGVECFVLEGWSTGLGNPANVSPRTGWTDRGESDLGNTTGGVYTYDTVGTADVTFGITAGAGDPKSVFGIAIAESGGGAAAEHRPFMMMGAGG